MPSPGNDGDAIDAIGGHECPSRKRSCADALDSGAHVSRNATSHGTRRRGRPPQCGTRPGRRPLQCGSRRAHNTNPARCHDPGLDGDRISARRRRPRAGMLLGVNRRSAEQADRHANARARRPRHRGDGGRTIQFPGMTENPDAASRVVQGIIQGIMAGISFIGAGVVLRDPKEQSVHGLTTAATVWVTAALGIACGLGAWRTVAIALPIASAVAGRGAVDRGGARERQHAAARIDARREVPREIADSKLHGGCAFARGAAEQRACDLRRRHAHGAGILALGLGRLEGAWKFMATRKRHRARRRTRRSPRS